MKIAAKTMTFCVLSTLATASMASTKSITVGILVPVEVPAMKQIVSGFETTFTKESKVPVTYLVKNAQGDANMQRSILQEFNSQHVNLIAPIGTDASQMAIAMTRNIPIVGIAADHLKEEAKKANNLNVTGLTSKTPPKARMGFIHAALPKLKKLTLVYSTDARIFNQVKEFEAVAKKEGITVQPLMVSQLSDLYSISNSIASDSQAIFVLKDEMVVSGINTLLQQAHTKHIPVIASDDGSVSKGAVFALGVSEYQSGVDSAKIGLQIINGKKASDIPVHVMTHYFVYLNPTSAKTQNVNVEAVKAAAKKLNYTIQIL